MMPYLQQRFSLILSCVLITASFHCSIAQNSKIRWTDHFSYANVLQIKEINGYIFAASENGLFSYDPNSGELEKNSKVDDLNDVDITSFNYSNELEMMMIGYRSGEMDFLTPDENRNLLEIPLHQFFTGSKQVNHMVSEGKTAIISGEFGLATFDLEAFEFLETCYFNMGGNYFGVKQTALLDGVIYAASDQGVFRHPLNEFITNFIAWEQIQALPTTAFQKIIQFQQQLFVADQQNVYRFDGDTWQLFGNFPNLKDLTVNDGVLSIVQSNTVRNYNENLGLIDTQNFTQNLNTALKIGNQTYGGSTLYGLILGNQEILPDGPYNNKSWSVTAHQKKLWIAPGGINNFNSPSSNPDGFYHFDGMKWTHHLSQEMLNAKDIVDIEVNPKDPTEWYVSSWMEYISWDEKILKIGMFQYKNGQMTKHYNLDNSSLKHRHRIAGSAFDDMGNLWVGQTAATDYGDDAMLHKKTPAGTWKSIRLLAANGNPGARKPFVYNEHAFMALPRQTSGLKMTDMNQVWTVDESANRGALPSSEVIAAAIDKRGTLWIGTTLGIRILYNPIETIKTANFETQPVIIEQNGIPEALLTNVQINDIAIDGANQKWIATETGGVYCVSADGTKTIHYFSKENSPLPANKINKISIDTSTGEVYFATDKGVVSYRSDTVEGGDSFGDVYAYPNPVRPGFQGEVTIKGLPIDADVRIVDVVGNLIYQTKATGSVAKWDTKNFKGKPVASGIYLVLMTNKDVTESKQTKIAIVR